MIEFVSFDSEYVKTPKGGYSKGTVHYIDLDSGRAKKQTMMNFTNPKVFDTMKSAKAGDTFDVTVRENDKGYAEWAAATPAATDSIGVSAAAAPNRGGSTGKVLGSQYETREERIARQRLIVRQSCLSNAIEMLKMDSAKTPLTSGDVFDVAEDLYDWVYEPAELLLNNPGTGEEHPDNV